MIWVSLVGKLGFQTLRFQNYFFDLLISSIEYVACLEVLTMRLNAHSQPTVKAWISHKANAPHHAAKVCDVYKCAKLCKRRSSCGYNNRRQSPLLRVNARVIEDAWPDDLHD